MHTHMDAHAHSCVFLVAFGVIAKISAVINSIPYCVLGGMTTFLFVNIVVSGVKILGPELGVRRNRFIVAASLAIGLGVALVPQWANNDLVRSAGDVNNRSRLHPFSSPSLPIPSSTLFSSVLLSSLLFRLRVGAPPCVKRFS